MNVRIFTALAAVAGLTLAAGPGARAQRQVLPAAPVVVVAPPRTPLNYRLSPYDLVEVKVFQEDDMNWTVRVAKDGAVNLPVVGQINVNDKTPDQLGAEVRTRLLDGYLVHPQVSVTVLEFAKRRFTILGEVQKAGQIDFPDNSTVNLLQAVGMAGGYTKGADPGRVYVKRRVGAREIVLKVDAKRLARDPQAEAFQILPDDTITVARTIF